MVLMGRVRQFLANPITSVGIGIVGVVAAWFFYLLSLSRITPVYRVSPVEVVARQESPRLSVAWEGHPIPNLCVCRVAFWNEGEIPLRSSDLPLSDPLRIVPTKNVHILTAEVSNVSRRTLSLNLSLTPTAVLVGINGNDALEEMDGAAIRVLFTGDCGTDFDMRGRVIGVASGFHRGIAFRPIPKWLRLVTAGIVVLMMILLVGRTVTKFVLLKDPTARNRLNGVRIMPHPVFIVTLLLVTVWFYDRIVDMLPVSNGPAWTNFR
jgi:hypothetical protein